MQKTPSKTHQEDFAIQDDIEKIKSGLIGASKNIKGKTEQVLSDSYDDLKEKTKEMQGDVADYITRKPFKSLGIALLAGIVLGYLLHK